MDREQRIEQEIQRTLGQFDNEKRLEPNPFFFARVQARLKKQDEAGRWIPIAGLLKPALLVLLVACNIATAAVLLKDGVAEDVDHSGVTSAIGEELGLNSGDAYFFLTE